MVDRLVVSRLIELKLSVVFSLRALRDVTFSSAVGTRPRMSPVNGHRFPFRSILLS